MRDGAEREIESVTDLDEVLARTGSLAGWHLQSVDLRGHAEALRDVDVHGALLLGCDLPDDGVEDLLRRGALVFPTIPDLPFDPYRATLYTPDELYSGLDEGYAATLDARVYAWSRRPRALDRTLAAALHDHAVDDALGELVRERRLVGVMGGHALPRSAPAYAEAARLGHALSQHHTVATGGGPGAMEAANLGALLGHADETALDAALEQLGGSPGFVEDATGWARAAMDVRAGVVDPVLSLGVPTWFYGHEPPNAFASQAAKYFTNAIREDVLLRVCGAGIVFLPGAAGTVQEIFQAACENYYADAEHARPLVLLGRDHWERELPAWPLLEALAHGRGEHDVLGPQLHLIDHVDEVGPLVAGG